MDVLSSLTAAKPWKGGWITVDAFFQDCSVCLSDMHASETYTNNETEALITGGGRQKRSEMSASSSTDERSGLPERFVQREALVKRCEELTRELFLLHDLNGDGVLEENELVRLNEAIAILHYGIDSDLSAVRAKYVHLFRTKLDPKGHPIPYGMFRSYAHEVLQALDDDPQAQEMILEQFIAEALTGREALRNMTPQEKTLAFGRQAPDPPIAPYQPTIDSPLSPRWQSPLSGSCAA
mmetsp:Transcript_42308/g.90883  ORF Transcript_42308/g.90883 Transcript_42308/m.90883 type:complete len:238 (+) Transcript_42308:402-1115(+)